MYIKIELTRKEFTELLTLAHIGEYVRNGVLDDRNEYNPEQHLALTAKLYQLALEHKFTEVEKSKLAGMDYVGPTIKFDESMHELIGEYEEEHFWHELITRLSHRDFYRTITPEEKQQAEKEFWLPKRHDKIVDQYDNEFEQFGIERLEINKQAEVATDLKEYQ